MYDECLSKCGLYKNQLPLFDKKVITAEVLWVGLSAKKVKDVNDDIPLSPDTNTGKIIREIERGLPAVRFYKTNLVKCLPLNAQGRLRYPTLEEMNYCHKLLMKEVKKVKPRVVVLLGKSVVDFMSSNNKISISYLNNEYTKVYKDYDGTYFLYVNHPSYIYIYKRKQISSYILNVESSIRSLLSLTESEIDTDHLLAVKA